MSYKKIIVPFDGSKFAKNALEEAIRISKMTKGTIYLCTVISISSIVPPGSLLGLMKEASTGELQRKMMRSAKISAKKMGDAQVDHCKSKGVKAQFTMIIDGYVSEEILRFSKRKRADLIVIGSQGLQGMEKIKTLGSVSRKVSELAQCPVLIVR